MNVTWLGVLAGAWILGMVYVGYRRGLVKEILSLMFVISSLVLVWIVKPYVKEFLTDRTIVYEKVKETSQDFAEKNLKNISVMQEEFQRDALTRLPVPDILKETLLQKEVAEGQIYLNADEFAFRISEWLTDCIMNGISFIVSYLLITIILRIAAAILNGIASLPVLRSVNYLAGACIGGLKGVMFIWLLLLILTLFYNTELGKAGMRLVENDTFISILYKNDILIKLFMNIL